MELKGWFQVEITLKGNVSQDTKDFQLKRVTFPGNVTRFYTISTINGKSISETRERKSHLQYSKYLIQKEKSITVCQKKNVSKTIYFPHKNYFLILLFLTEKINFLLN